MARSRLVEAIATVLGVAALTLLWFAGPGRLRPPADADAVLHPEPRGDELRPPPRRHRQTALPAPSLHHRGGRQPDRHGDGRRPRPGAAPGAPLRGSPVSFIAVDRTTIGDTRGAVDTLDSERVAHRSAG
ncbi:hypothetical protein [Streptomyces sp. JH14]|uniref:hypothetical protein n=1 Tax=Streptomyces sp. JH14 TaxID=2793630 RepID=UPI003211E298